MKGSHGLVVSFVAAAICAWSQPAMAACSTKPPPEGLVERCHSKDFTVSDAQNAEQRCAALRVTLMEWMKTCVIEDRAEGLVGGAESVDTMCDMIKDLTGPRVLKIIPDYTPLTYKEGAKTCFGVKSVDFHFQGAQGVVEPGEPETSGDDIDSGDE
jgi:hypothetical protein